MSSFDHPVQTLLADASRRPLRLLADERPLLFDMGPSQTGAVSSAQGINRWP